MKVSFPMFGLEMSEYRTLAVLAEELGYDGVWLGDHLVHPRVFESGYPYNDTGDVPYANDAPLADVWTVIGHLAAVTSTLKLGPGVLILPLRPVLVTAQAAATAQALSGGRVRLGIGTGWLRQEFEAAGVDFEGRGRRTDEYVDALRLLATGEPCRFDGDYVRLDDVRVTPALRPPVPIVVGGLSPPALRRAALRGDGWFGMVGSLEETLETRSHIEALREEAGRSQEPFTYHPRLPDPADRQLLDRYQEAGFDAVVLSLKAMRGSSTLDDRRRAIEDAATRLGLEPA